MPITTAVIQEALSAELDDLENHEGHDVTAILDRATAAAEAADLLGDVVMAHRARLVQADMRRREGEVDQAVRVFLTTHRWAERHECRPLLARTHFHLALTYHYLGDHAASLEHSLNAVELLDEAAPGGLRIIYLIRLANSLAENGSTDQARERYRQAEQIAVDISDVRRQLLALNNLAYTELEAGNAATALAAVERMYRTARAIGRDLLIIERDTVANIHISAGRYAEAEAILADVYDAPPWYEAHDAVEAALTLALAQRHRNALDRAQASLEHCRQLCAEHQLNAVAVRVMAEQAELYAAAGDHRAAFEEYKRYHSASEQLRSTQQEAKARARQALFETAEARRDAERYREQARRDPLTGLYNRRFVDERLPDTLAAATSGAPVTLSVIDIDHFKRINDTLSHDTGDRVLIAVAEVLSDEQDRLAADGFVARLGGEEFLLVLPGIGAGRADAVLDAIRLRIATHGWHPITGDLPVTVSIGAVSTESPAAAGRADLLAEADRRLYAAKHNGRNRVITN
ncbi:diguanylate cyclase [Actinoplanes sp. GCM10030250]|uniref:GGDEF domain-containing protein n=1 Tax=Actinoplanes sp. GCM10030250 TaxID=3273376 RepID=UPI00360C8213